MEADIAKLREQLRAAESRALEEQRQREEEQHRRETAESRVLEQQHQREAAEQRASASLPSTLHQYLEICHSLHLSLQVVTDRSLTTQGETTNPTGRILPPTNHSVGRRLRT